MRTTQRIGSALTMILALALAGRPARAGARTRVYRVRLGVPGLRP